MSLIITIIAVIAAIAGAFVGCIPEIRDYNDGKSSFIRVAFLILIIVGALDICLVAVWK